MATRRADHRPHIVLEGTSTAEAFTSPSGGGGDFRTVSVDRARHGTRLREQLAAVEAQLELRRGRPLPAGVEAPQGFYLEFESPPGFKLWVESLESSRSGIELMSVHRRDEKQFAIVYIPEGKIAHFVKLVDQYLTQNTRPSEKAPNGNPRNRKLLESIAQIRLAIAESFWTDDLDSLPQPNVLTWWEVWLRGTGEAVLQRFRAYAEALRLTVADRHLTFPERTVVLMEGTLERFAGSLEFLDILAELRAPTEVGSFFTRLAVAEQRQWAANLVQRTQWPDADAVAVCILDTGVNRGHPLLEHVLADNDVHTCNPSWGKHDHLGHGTEMAGIATYGDLRRALASASPIQLAHRIESVKIFPPSPASNRKELYGAITAEGVSRAEIEGPHRLRVISMAIASTEDVERGQPSAWSSEIDALCVGTDEWRRLFFVSAGNVKANAGLGYRSRNEVESIHVRRRPGMPLRLEHTQSSVNVMSPHTLAGM